MAFDLLVKHAMVVDGTGMPRYMADVGVLNGRIAQIGRITEGAKETINANGRALAPGFIDFHTHFDAQLTWDPLGRSSPEHGVTTVITGNCGLTLTPCKPGDKSDLIGNFVRVEAIPREVLETVDWKWGSFSEYQQALKQRVGINVAGYVGHNAIRWFVMGKAAAEREATDDEITAMQQVVRQSLSDGAIGISTDQNPNHYRDDGTPIPSRLASRKELLALASAMGESNTGVFQIPSEGGGKRADNIAWFAQLARAAHRPVLWGSIKARWNEPDLWREQLDEVGNFFQEGLPLYSYTTIRPNVTRFTLQNCQLFDEFPTWRATMMLPAEQRKKALAEAKIRDQFRIELRDQPLPVGKGGYHRRWDLLNIVETALPKNKDLDGLDLEEAAKRRGKDPLDLFLDLALEEDLATSFVSRRVGEEDMMAGIIQSPYVFIGQSDAGAHVAFSAGFGYSSLLLGDWVRDRKAMSLEAAGNNLTFKVSSLFGLGDRGLIWPGWAADLVLFDPENIGAMEPEEEADYPGGSKRMVQHARGVEYTVVNGEVLLDHGVHRGSTPGTVIKNAAVRGA